MILLSFIRDRTSARVPFKLLPDTKHVKIKPAKSQRGDCFHERLPPGRWLLLSPGVCPCFATALLMYECCLYPAKTAVAFYSKRNNTVHWWRLCAGRSVACLCSPLHVTKWSGQDLADASFCPRCAAADLGCKRLLGGTGTPCGHFTPDAAPPLSLCFPHTSPTAPPTRHCAQLHVPAALYSH